MQGLMLCEDLKDLPYSLSDIESLGMGKLGKDPPHSHVELHDFVEELRKLLERCGGPSLRDLGQISAHLGEYYGKQYVRMPRLQPSTLSAILNGRRKGLPSWRRVAAIVLSCEWNAWTTGISGQRPVAKDVLHTWDKMHQALRAGDVISVTAAQQTVPAPVAAPGSHLQGPHAASRSAATADGTLTETVLKPGPKPSSITQQAARNDTVSRAGQLVTDARKYANDLLADTESKAEQVLAKVKSEVDRIRTATQCELEEARRELDELNRQREGLTREPDHLGQTAEQLTIVELTHPSGDQPVQDLDRSQARFTKLFGAYGRELYDRAEGGDNDAAHGVGLLLSAVGHPSEGEAYLDRAARNWNHDARRLLEVIDPGERQRTAVELAYLAARQAFAECDIEAALTYSRVAAGQGHAEAAPLAATLLLERDGRAAAAEADMWLSVAAKANSGATALARARARRLSQLCQSERADSASVDSSLVPWPLSRDPGSYPPYSSGSAYGEPPRYDEFDRYGMSTDPGYQPYGESPRYDDPFDRYMTYSSFSSAL